MRKDNKIKSAYASLTGFKRAVPIMLFALALFIGLCFIAPGSVGLGKYVANFLKGLFSIGAFFIPPLLMIHALFYPQDTIKKRCGARFIFSTTMLFFFSAFLHAIRSFSADSTFSPSEFYVLGKELSGGGFFGGGERFIGGGGFYGGICQRCYVRRSIGGVIFRFSAGNKERSKENNHQGDAKNFFHLGFSFLFLVGCKI